MPLNHAQYKSRENNINLRENSVKYQLIYNQQSPAKMSRGKQRKLSLVISKNVFLVTYAALHNRFTLEEKVLNIKFSSIMPMQDYK